MREDVDLVPAEQVELDAGGEELEAFLGERGAALALQHAIEMTLEIDLKLLNMTPQPRVVEVWTDGLPGATLSLADSKGESSERLSFELEADKVLPVRLYVHADPAGLDGGPTRFQIRVKDADGVTASADTTFETPESRK